jgi:hypothetical protein
MKLNGFSINLISHCSHATISSNNGLRIDTAFKKWDTSANEFVLFASGPANIPFITSRNDFEFIFGDQISSCSAIITDFLSRRTTAFHAINNQPVFTKTEME